MRYAIRYNNHWFIGCQNAENNDGVQWLCGDVSKRLLWKTPYTAREIAKDFRVRCGEDCVVVKVPS